MSNPIVFTVTNAGLAAALSAQQNGLLLKLNKFVVGSGKQVVNADTPALVSQWGEFPIAAGDVETASKTLRFSAVVSSNTKKDVFEMGLYTDTNILFAVASITGSEPLFSVYPNIDFIGSFGLALGQIDAASITVLVDTNSALALSIFNQHVTASNPHPQYAKAVTSIIAGDGLTGGGTLEGDRIVEMGVPSTISSTSSNQVTDDSHTHAIEDGNTSRKGIVRLFDGLNSDADDLALTARQGRVLSEKIDNIEFPEGIQIVDNLTSDSATSALSARQGRAIAIQTIYGEKGLTGSGTSGYGAAIRLDTYLPYDRTNLDYPIGTYVLVKAPDSGIDMNGTFIIELLPTADRAIHGELYLNQYLGADQLSGDWRARGSVRVAENGQISCRVFLAQRVY